MLHNIKLPDGSIQSIDCQYGSSWKDKYGREIFECHQVRLWNSNDHVYFVDSDWFVGSLTLSEIDPSSIEIIGEEED